MATNEAGERLTKKGKGEVLLVLLGSDCFIAKQRFRKMEEQLDSIEEIAKGTDFA